MPKVAHKKSFADYLTKEDHLHSAVMKYLKLKYPKVLVIHCPNEGKRTPFEQFKAKALGITAGVPDILIFEDGISEMANGLAIELKVHPNKCTPEQIECMERLRGAGWSTRVCHTLDEAIKEIDNYLN